MDKLNMQTTNIVDENIKRIGELFPNCLTERLNDEGKPEVAIDFDQLRQELSKDIVEGAEERYQFTWPDKRNAIRLANASTTDTLRPVREDETTPTGIDSTGKPYCSSGSVDFDNTQNLYIEGDNLQVLKLLRENYLGKVNLIYIDPPYNTGNDFVYNDDFSQTAGEYIHNSGQTDEEGNCLVVNTESNGRFHTDWLNMIYPRLKVAKDLLSEDGVIFISIDDNEIINLKKLCDEVLGASNYVTTLIIESSVIAGPRRVPAMQGSVVKTAEYCLAYSRNGDNSIIKNLKYDFIEGFDSHYCNWLDEKNKRILSLTDLISNTPSIMKRFSNYNLKPNYKNLGNIIAFDDTIREWLYSNSIASTIYRKGSKEKLEPDNYPLYQMFKVGGKWYIKTEEGIFNVFRYIDRIGICDDYFHSFGERQVRGNLWKGFSSDGGNLDKEGSISFKNGKKPIRLIKQLLDAACKTKDALIMDFFSGSATTAHAVMQLNAEDGGKRKFIMVQLPEATDDKSDAYKAGFKNICEIGKERIRRSGKKIKEDSPLTTQDLDTGFRVLKLDSSNMQDVYYTPSEFDEQKLFDDNIKPDRLGNDGEDLLFQTMIELGIELSAKIEKKSVAGKAVWSVSDGYMMACFDEEVNETTITEIARQHPYYFVMRDSSLANDQVADNFEQIWEEYSKDTVRRIL